MPLPAHRCRLVQAPVKTVMAPDLSLRGAKRRGNLSRGLPRWTGHRRTCVLTDLTVAALPERHVRDNSTAGGRWCTAAPPDVSLCGARRRGALRAKREEVPLGCNLAVPGRITGKPRRKRNCLPEIAPQGHFLALRAQGATSAVGLLAMTHQGGAVVHQSTSAVELPCTRRSLSAATDAIGACHCIDTQRESPVQRRARHAAHPQRAIDVPPVFHHQFPGIIPLAGAYI